MSVVSVGDSLDPGPVEKRFEHVFSFEDFARNIESGARVFRVVGIDSFHGICDFVHCSKRQESFLTTIIFGETGFLRNEGTTCCEITGGAIAEPAGIMPSVLVLRAENSQRRRARRCAAPLYQFVSP